jgi:hypothetical protein
MKTHAWLIIFVILVLAIFKRYDGFFGTSPGTMVQLRTSHVPTEQDVYYWKNIYPKIVRREVYNMTEIDLH